MTANVPAFTSNPPQIHDQKTTFCTPFLPKPPAKTQFSSLEKKYPKFSLRGGESESVVVFFQGEAEGFDDEVVVVALRQAGDGN